MPDSLITCPNCQTQIPLTSAIEGPIVERLRKQFELNAQKAAAEVTKKVQALAAQEKLLATKLASIEDARRHMDEQVAQQVKKEREKIAIEALAAARKEQAASLTDLQQQLTDKEQKLALAQRMELELRKQQRELEEKKQAFELEAARTLDAERAKIKADALKAADEAHRLKEAEKDKQLADMRQQIDDLKRKAEQGSQQLQGEVLELELERLLRSYFPHDQITPVAKGIHGGDVIHRVCTPAAQACGTILWESKRTKTWSDGWIEKLKEDQRAAKADIAVIVSTTLPKDVTTMTCIDGVWVTSRDCMMGMVSALRAGLVRLAEVHRAAEGKHEKMEVLYRYLSGHEFQQRVEAIVDAFVTLREDLEAEKRFITKNWAKREKQIDRVMASTTGMYGDLSGIIGGALPKIATIDLPALPSGEEDTDATA